MLDALVTESMVSIGMHALALRARIAPASEWMLAAAAPEWMVPIGMHALALWARIAPSE